MTRLQKRLDELELIQNNTKLLSELLSHYKPDTGGEHEKLLIMVCTVHTCNRPLCVSDSEDGYVHVYIGVTVILNVIMGSNVAQNMK